MSAGAAEVEIMMVNINDECPLGDSSPEATRKRRRAINAGDLIVAEIWPNGDFDFTREPGEGGLSEIVHIPSVHITHALGHDEFSRFEAFEAAWKDRYPVLVEKVSAAVAAFPEWEKDAEIKSLLSGTWRG